MNEERERAAGNKFFKCFVGRCGDRFIMDHGVARPGGQDMMRFYESTDLRSWSYLSSNSPDPRWYGRPPQPARWDHMYILPKEEGNPAAGYWGHVVAVPKPGDPPGVGMMESADGRAWNVLPPAPMLWPKGMETVSHFEYGGCERINGKYFMMRRKGQTDAFHSACIALGRSKDLVHWEVGDPCCTPNRFNCFEVPDVFKLGEKWYLIALTGDGYGQSHRWSDPNITCATVVFQADRPEGPFEEVKAELAPGFHRAAGLQRPNCRTPWRAPHVLHAAE